MISPPETQSNQCKNKPLPRQKHFHQAREHWHFDEEACIPREPRDQWAPALHDQQSCYELRGLVIALGTELARLLMCGNLLKWLLMHLRLELEAPSFITLPLDPELGISFHQD